MDTLSKANAVQSTWLKIDSLYKKIFESKKKGDLLSDEQLLLESMVNTPDLIITGISPEGMITFSNSPLLQNPLTNTTKHIREYVSEKDLQIFTVALKEVLKTGSLKKTHFSLKAGINSTSRQSAVIIPYSQEEAIMLSSGHLASSNIGMSITNLMEILASLPGTTLIANSNHHIVKVDKGEKLDTDISVGESIECSNLNKYKGVCGQMHLCERCELRAAIANTRRNKVSVVRKEITLPVRSNGKLKYKKYLVTTSCIHNGGEENYLVYLEDLIDDKRQLKQLKDANELLSSVLNSLPFGVYWKNLNSTYLGGNSKFTDDLNIKDEGTLIGMNDTNFFDIETAQMNVRDDQLTLSIDKPTLRHENVFYGQHTQKKQKIMKAPLIDGKGKKVGVIGAKVDFVPEKWFEVNEDESHQSLANMADHVDTALWEWDLKNDVLSGNKAWRKTTKLGKKKHSLRKFLSKIHNDDEKILLDIEEKIKVNKDYQFKQKVRILLPDQEEVRWIEMEGKKIYMDLLGNPEKVIGWAHDVTSCAEKELEYCRKDTFASALLDSCNELIWSVDKNFTFISLNQALKARLFLMHQEEFEVGRNFFEKLNGSGKEKWEKRYHKAFQGGHFSVTEDFDDHGVNKIAETSINPIVIDGEIVGASCFSRIKNKEIL